MMAYSGDRTVLGGTRTVSRAKVEHAEQDWFDRKEEEKREVIWLRLPASDIADLRFLWCELASRIGLRSNMSSQQEQLARLSTIDFKEDSEQRKTRERKRRKDKLTPAEELSDRAAKALDSLPAHVQASLAQDEPEPIRRRRSSRGPRILNGVLLAHGYEPQTMCVGNGRGGGHLHMVEHEMMDPWSGEPVTGLVSSLDPAEMWSDMKNEEQSGRVKRTRATLIQMQVNGDGGMVNALFAMYGGSLPSSEFPSLDDTAPLALDTHFVTAHAATMTKKLKGNEYATCRTAIHDLIDKRPKESPERKIAREKAIATIKTEATWLLVRASEAYMKAKGMLP